MWTWAVPVGSELNEGLGSQNDNASEHAAALGLERVWERPVDLERTKEKIGRCPCPARVWWFVLTVQ